MPSNARRIAGLIQLNDFDGRGIDAVVTEKELNDGTLDIRARNAVVDDSLIVPIGDTVARPSNIEGSIRYNTDLQSFEGYSDGRWAPIAGAGGAVGGNDEDAFYENTNTITESYTISEGKNAMTAGPVSVEEGVEITVLEGSVWSIV